MVTNLSKAMVERLTLYKATNNKLPSRVLVYRDGVSEGQFKQVLEQELPMIKGQCNRPIVPYSLLIRR